MDVLQRNISINAEIYCQKLHQLVLAIREKRRRLISTGYHNIHFFPDVPPHAANLTKNCKLLFFILPHPIIICFHH